MVNTTFSNLNKTFSAPLQIRLLQKEMRTFGVFVSVSVSMNIGTGEKSWKLKADKNSFHQVEQLGKNPTYILQRAFVPDR